MPEDVHHRQHRCEKVKNRNNFKSFIFLELVNLASHCDKWCGGVDFPDQQTPPNASCALLFVIYIITPAGRGDRTDSTNASSWLIINVPVLTTEDRLGLLAMPNIPDGK
jgi:hypothetical protein